MVAGQVLRTLKTDARSIAEKGNARMLNSDSEPTNDLDDSLGDAPSWYGNSSATDPVDEIRSALERGESDFDADTMPSQFDGYSIHSRVGSGAMGVVYRATSASGATVAIKALRPEVLARRDALSRFQREARMLAAVEHPNLTRLIEVGHSGPHHYLVLEYVYGPSLARMIGESGILSEPLALEMMAQVASGLAILHPRGIVHRDIKPGNILVRRPENLSAELEPDAVKLTDFGLARSFANSNNRE